MSEKLLVPDIGDFEEVEIIEILVKEGDKISKNDPVITLESDKSSVEVPSAFEGVVDSINIKIGDKVSKGDLILTLSSENGTQQKQETIEKIPPATEKIIAEAEDSNGYNNSDLDTSAHKEIKVENVAAVMVTAELPPFAKPGQKIDVNISAIGVAESLRGGSLIMTRMRGVDGEIYALAQGPLTVTGVMADAAGTSVQIGVPTSGRIPNGAIVERMVETPFETAEHIVLNVRDIDFSTTNAIAQEINKTFGSGVAFALDGVSVAVRSAVFLFFGGSLCLLSLFRLCLLFLGLVLPWWFLALVGRLLLVLSCFGFVIRLCLWSVVLVVLILILLLAWLPCFVSLVIRAGDLFLVFVKAGIALVGSVRLLIFLLSMM